MIARGEIETPRGTCTDRSPAFVIDGCHTSQHGRKACAPRLQAEVEILEPEEIILVEQSARVEYLAPDEHQTSADAIDPAGSRAIARRHEAAAVAEMSHPPADRCVRHAQRLDLARMRSGEDDRPCNRGAGHGIETALEL